MDCKSCREAQYVPRTTHDTDMAILEGSNRRLCIFLAAAVIALLASWMFFFWYRDQYMCEITEIRIEQHLDEPWPN